MSCDWRGPCPIIVWRRAARGSSDPLRDLISQNDSVERDLDSLRDKAQANIEEIQRRNAKEYNLRRRPAREYQVGDYVEIRNIDTTVG